MAMGRVKWFSDVKGFGFIQTTSGDEVFVHYTAILSQGRKTLKEGQEVEFDLYDDQKGFLARNVALAEV